METVEIPVVVGFTGTRKGASPIQLVRIKQVLVEIKPDWVTHGAAEGADTQFHVIAKELKLKVRLRPCHEFIGGFEDGDIIDP